MSELDRFCDVCGVPAQNSVVGYDRIPLDTRPEAYSGDGRSFRVRRQETAQTIEMACHGGSCIENCRQGDARRCRLVERRRNLEVPIAGWNGSVCGARQTGSAIRNEGGGKIHFPVLCSRDCASTTVTYLCSTGFLLHSRCRLK